MESVHKKNLDISSKECIVKEDKSFKIPKNEVIKVLKILEGLKRTLLGLIK
jgi:hypothetical protein